MVKCVRIATKVAWGLLLTVALSAQAVAPPRGNDRLRELVAYPQMNLSLNYGVSFQCDELIVSKGIAPEIQISQLREALKQHPDEVRQLLQLGTILESQGDTNAATACYRQAEQVCRSRMAARPQDGLALTDLGKALHQMGDNGAAENTFRKAVLVSSNDWRCWVGLGDFLVYERFLEMYPDKFRRGLGLSTHSPAEEILNFRPEPQALKRAEAAGGEASRCFDRALALAPRESEVYFQRAGFMCVSNWQNCLLRHYRDGEEIGDTQLTSAFFAPEAVANMERAAELDYNNYERISLAAYFGWTRGVIEAGSPTNYTVDMLPEKSRRSIRNDMTHLENLSEKSDPKLAAGALECLGFLNFAFKNQAVALADFKHAVALDPSREASWDLWLGMLIFSSGTPQEIVTVCQSRLDHQDSARNHLLLAKALVRAGKWSDAIIHAEAAGKLETNNVVPPLFVAAIALKQSAQTNYLAMAGEKLAQANVLMGKMSAGNDKAERMREFGLNVIIFYVLANEPDMARNTARDYLKYFPDSEEVREIMKDLGENQGGR